MTNLYNRRLLTEYEAIDIEHVLDDAIAFLEGQAVKVENTVKDALIGRLQFRKAILSAVSIDVIADRQRATSWTRCMEMLPTIKQSTIHGVPVHKSFSVKIQRRLASSVPPRPIVSISFDDAYTFLCRLCQHAKEAYGVLDYHGGAHLLVCHNRLS